MESNIEDIEIQKLFEEPESLINTDISDIVLDLDENKIDDEISNIEINDSDEEVETPDGEVETPMEGVETPMKGVETPMKGVETPMKGVETPMEGVEKNNLEKEIEQKKLDTEVEELADDFLKIQDRQAQKKMQLDLLIEMIRSLNFDVSSIKDICSLTFDRDFLKQRSIQNKITAFIPELRKCYNSAYLTCLHANAELKQKNLGINTLRQIMKCNYLKMTPKKVSHGYDKATGKKLESRIYLIEKMLY
jgi:hypothetical protein